MRADSTTFTKLMSQNHQMIIPIYQRVYSWKKSEWERLWEDIREAATNGERKNHYTGTVYYIDDNIMGTGIDTTKYLLIDGQQRMTTLSIFVIALCQFINSDTDRITESKLYSYYLMNKEEVGEDRYKLIPLPKDKDTYLAILNQDELPDNPSRRIVECYQYFVKTIQNSGLSADIIYEGLQKLTVINSRLEKGIDDPQLIFEGLNSTGRDLSEAEKIKNYVFMSFSHEEQDELYHKYWLKMENLFGEDTSTDVFDRFFRDYLTIKTENSIKLDQLYEFFKTFSIESRDDYHPTEHLKDWVKEMYDYAKSYAAIRYETIKDNELNRVIQHINSLKSDVCYALLLQVYYDFSVQQALTVEQVKMIFETVESYLIRRSICELPTNSLSSIFASLVHGIDEFDYVNSIVCNLLIKKKKYRFPSDDEFREALIEKELYKKRKPLSQLFYRLENEGRKEFVPTHEYTVEHIMPQNKNISDEWKESLGDEWKDVQETYLHTLGNLTLTGYNSELSDSSFEVKKTIEGGFANSPLRLNRILANEPTWNKEAIVKRAAALAEDIISIWQYPTVSEEALHEYTPVKSEGRGGGYDISVHLQKMSSYTRELFFALKEEMLAIDPAVQVVVLKRYIAFKYNTNILDVRPQKKQLDVIINLKIDDLQDVQTTLPIRDIRVKRSRANGEIDLKYSKEEQVPEIIKLAKISMSKQVIPTTIS